MKLCDLKIVSNQPTAFDIDAVVEELEKEQESLDTDIFAKENDDWYGELCNGRMEGLDKAIEIIHSNIALDATEN